MLRHQVEIGQHGLHGRIKPAAVLQLQRQAFGNRSRHHAGRFETLANRQHGGHIGNIRAQRLGDIF